MANPTLKDPANLIATWFGCGLITPAPGTWGSLGAIPFALMIVALTGFYGFLMAIIILTPIGFWATHKYEIASGVHDNKQIVVDEVLGQWIALAPVFYYSASHGGDMSLIPYSISVIAAFLLFRVFDITKPWPISHFDKNVKGATGVMVDDIIAGIFAAILVAGGLYAKFG